MDIVVNGEERVVEDGTTVGGLLILLDIERRGIAVDVNREIVPKGRHEEHTLKDGDKVEIVQMVGGG